MIRAAAIAGMSMAHLVTGCGGMDGDSMMIDQALVGDWEECENSDRWVSFGVDGSYSYNESGEDDFRIDGTHSADGRMLSIASENQDGAPTETEMTYYASDTTLVLLASRPLGSNDGVVGTWESRLWSTDGVEVSGYEQVLELRDDMTGHVTRTPYDDTEPADREVVWELDSETPGGYRFGFQEGSINFWFSFQFIDDNALGTPYHCRR